MKYYLNALRNYANFSGRASRAEYWLFYLFNSILGGIVYGICYGAGTEELYFLYYIPLIIPALSVGFRRIQDTGKSGWLLFVPIYSLILLLTPGQSGENQYGIEPL